MKIMTFLLLSLTLLACQPDEPEAPGLPSNLNTQLTITNGEVHVIASADSANFYTVTFYDNNDTITVETQDGEATHIYNTSGTYKIRTRAHTLQTSYIEKVEEVLIEISTGNTGAPTSGFISPLTYPNMSLVWQDEFNGASLSSDWTYDIGTGSWGWGNNELQYYKQDNAVVADGILTITAKNENFNSSNYTSSRIKTQGIKSWKYGRIDVRAALPYGQGIWPAIWMLGDNITSAGWPACGEIDIMELIGGAGANDRTVHGTVHWSNNGTHAQYGGSKTLPSGKFADNFHVFSITWDANSIHWLLDNVEYHSIDTSPADMAEFREKFFIIMNVAVGGNWPGSPDASTVFPQKMYVDYVRVFQ
ncbi:MAG: family 16 glycosylhydrolase [Sphingomonadales bacterium]